MIAHTNLMPAVVYTMMTTSASKAAALLPICVVGTVFRIVHCKCCQVMYKPACFVSACAISPAVHEHEEMSDSLH